MSRHPLLLCALWVGLTTLTATSLPGWSAPAPPAAEDPLDLAALLIGDGNLDRAAAVLAGVTEPADPTAAGRLWTLRGLVALRTAAYADAADALGRAIDLSPPPLDPHIYLSVSRARVLSGDPAGALDALRIGGTGLDAWPARFLVEARAHRDLGQPPAAWAALEAGAAAFPQDPDFQRQQVLLLVEMGLTREAGRRASALLERGQTTAADALTVAEALRQAGAIDRAMVLLEEARLRYPDEPRLDVRLAAVSVDAGRPLAAARLLQRAAARDPSMADEAAELFRRAGQLEAALMMNAQVLDPTEKARQRFGLLLDAGSFDRAVALQDRLSRLGLLTDDRVRYGLAYAWAEVGDLERAGALLSGISDPEVFRQATELRRVLQAGDP
jgi:tetratricopeptide (TPR) repeat protein